MFWNKIIPELSVTNLENSLKFYKTAGFKIEYRISASKDGEIIPVFDLIEIIGILLDNAREELEENGLDVWLKIKLFYCKEKFELSVQNRTRKIVQSELIDIFKTGYSTKDDNRGLGLSKIKEFQKKYRFNIFCEIKKKEGEIYVHT